jgi:NAD-dependent deacetylase
LCNLVCDFAFAATRFIMERMCDYATKLSVAADSLREAKHVVVFSGAGASAESGIPTFRDEGGLWSHFPPEQFATPQGLIKNAATDPRRAAEFVHALLAPIAAASPNDGHKAVAEIERHVRVTVITQNVDGLHQDAGSRTVHEVHGSVFGIVTGDGSPVRRIGRDELQGVVRELAAVLADGFTPQRAIAAVKPILSFDGERLCRPNIVLFGEAMAEPDWGKACEAARDCDCMVLVGTSGVVYPAAMLPEEAKSAGADVIAVGPERAFGDVWLPGTAAQILPALVRAAFD